MVITKRSHRNYSRRDLNILWGRSAARCAFPGCRIICITPASEQDREAIVGQVAHIRAHSPGGPRYDPNLEPANRNRYENLILLCSTHHAQVDRQPKTFTVEVMEQWKSDHEEWVQNCLTTSMSEITFHELEIVTSALLANPAHTEVDFALVPPHQKMARNSLVSSAMLLKIGMLQSRMVREFVEHMIDTHPGFPERLKSGFLYRYGQLLDNGLHGDELFEALAEFSAGGSDDFQKRAAGLAVLTYLFEACEVFEK